MEQITDRQMGEYAGPFTRRAMDYDGHTLIGVPITDAVKSCTLTPARIAGFADRKGSLEVGKDADVLLFDPDFRLHTVFAKGRRVR